VIEQLNFQKKKAELESVDPRQARMISSFACNKVGSGIKAACFRAGVEVIEVNPAYTPAIGAVEHAQQRGISVHMGAAFAIARRGSGLSERPTKRKVATPVRNGVHVTIDLPARNRSKHVWSFWANVRTRLKAAHKEHYRSGAHKDAPPLLRPLGPHWVHPVLSRCNPVTRIVSLTVRETSWKMFRIDGIFVHGFLNGVPSLT
jgi:hypothetical protein